MKRFRKISGFLAGVMILSSFSAGALASETRETVFDYTFDMPGASMEALDSSKTAAQMESITNTWIDTSIYNTGKYRAVNASGSIIDQGMSFRLENGVFGKSGNALKITGNDNKTYGGNDGNRFRIFNIKQINKKYTDYSSLDCTENGSFVVSFDFATSDLRVPFALRCVRTVFNNGGTLRETPALGKSLFVLNSNGSITVFNNTVSRANAGEITENTWHHVELVFSSSNKFGVKIDGRVVQQMTALEGAAAVGSLRSLGDAINIPVNYGNSTVSGGADTSRYIDNFKYEIVKDNLFETIEEDEANISVAEGDTVLMKSCSVLYVERTKKVSDLKAAVSGSTFGGNPMTAVVRGSEGELSDDELLSGAVSLELFDLYGISQKIFRIADSYETIAELSSGAPEIWQMKGGYWTKSDFTADQAASCIYTGSKMGGKTADDKFMVVKNTAANSSNTPSFNYWILDDGLTSNAPFTVEYSLYIPKMAAADKASNLYMYFNGKNSAGSSAMDTVLKLAPLPKNGTASVYNKNNSADKTDVQLGKWNKIAVEADPAKNEFTLYVNGRAMNKITGAAVNGITRIRFGLEGKSDACLFGIDDFRIHQGAYNYPMRDAVITLTDATGKFTVDNQSVLNGKIKAKSDSVTIADIAALVGGKYDYRIYTDSSFSSEATQLAEGNILVVNNGNGLYAYYDIQPEPSEIIETLDDGAPEVGTADKKGTWSRGSISSAELANCIYTSSGIGGKSETDSFMVMKNTIANNSPEANLNYWIENSKEYTDEEIEIEYSVYIPVLQQTDKVSNLYMQIIGSDTAGGSGRYYAYKILPSRFEKIATIQNNANSADKKEIALGRWNRIAVKIIPQSRKFILYVNGEAFNEISDTPLDRLTRICFKVEGASDVCSFAFDDLKIRRGAFNYTEAAPVFEDKNGKFVFDNSNGYFSATSAGCTAEDLTAALAGYDFRLFENDSFENEVSSFNAETVLVARSGSGMYSYYAVPEVYVDAEYADGGSADLKTLKLRLLYNGTADANDALISVAQYKNNELAKVSTAASSQLEKDNRFTFSVQKDADSQTAFIWKKGTLQPICAAVNVPVE